MKRGGGGGEERQVHPSVLPDPLLIKFSLPFTLLSHTIRRR